MNTPKTDHELSTDEARDTKDTTASGDQSSNEQAPTSQRGGQPGRVEKKSETKSEQKKGAAKQAKPLRKNNVRKMRMERMMSKAELARRAGLSSLTIDRVEKGMACRMDTKRKILEALGLTPSDRVIVFGEDD